MSAREVDTQSVLQPRFAACQKRVLVWQPCFPARGQKLSPVQSQNHSLEAANAGAVGEIMKVL